MNSEPLYMSSRGLAVIVGQGIAGPDGEWVVLERKPNGGLRRIKSKHLPSCETRAECELYLQKYATRNGWRKWMNRSRLEKWTPAKAKRAVERFNERYPVGTKVRVLDDLGMFADTETRSEAWVVADRQPVVSVEGRSGGYALERVFPVEG